MNTLRVMRLSDSAKGWAGQREHPSQMTIWELLAAINASTANMGDWVIVLDDNTVDVQVPGDFLANYAVLSP